MATKKNTSTPNTTEAKQVNRISTGDIRQRLEELNAMRAEQTNILNRDGVQLRKSRKGRRKSEYTIIMESLKPGEGHAFTLCSAPAGTLLDYMETGLLDSLTREEREYLESFRAVAETVKATVQKIRSSITRLQKATHREFSTVFTAEETGDNAGARVLVVTRES